MNSSCSWLRLLLSSLLQSLKRQYALWMTYWNHLAKFFTIKILASTCILLWVYFVVFTMSKIWLPLHICLGFFCSKNNFLSENVGICISVWCLLFLWPYDCLTIGFYYKIIIEEECCPRTISDFSKINIS